MDTNTNTDDLNQGWHALIPVTLNDEEAKLLCAIAAVKEYGAQFAIGRSPRATLPGAALSRLSGPQLVECEEFAPDTRVAFEEEASPQTRVGGLREDGFWLCQLSDLGKSWLAKCDRVFDPFRGAPYANRAPEM